MHWRASRARPPKALMHLSTLDYRAFLFMLGVFWRSSRSLDFYFFWGISSWDGRNMWALGWGRSQFQKYLGCLWYLQLPLLIHSICLMNFQFPPIQIVAISWFHLPHGNVTPRWMVKPPGVTPGGWFLGFYADSSRCDFFIQENPKSNFVTQITFFRGEKVYIESSVLGKSMEA